jgi:hypothetical protein
MSTARRLLIFPVRSNPDVHNAVRSGGSQVGSHCPRIKGVLGQCRNGVAPDLPVGLVLFALAGAADLVSEVLRSSLLQLSIPDRMRGRRSALWLAQANAAPALGNLEAASAAAISTSAISVISGGMACILGAALLARLCPALRTARLPQRRLAGRPRKARPDKHRAFQQAPVTAGGGR